MATIIGISGSLRQGSFNTALLRAAAEVAPAGTTLTTETLHGIPLYNADEESAQGLPAAVTRLKEAIVAADGLLLVTPEYNNGIPGVFKNAIDWLSRPSNDIGRVFGALPVAVIGASPGGFGTILSQAAWLPILRTLGTNAWAGGRLLVSRAGDVFSDGAMVDEAARRRLADFVAGFAAFAERNSRL
ncbi:NAD(P)H-dependent FMN reductase [Amaricoccus macauensis]|jgi:NAD(P)H-dependent FMN reductase|uniref:NAD(P)H-dependent FMN reductase n=1 Tax=Amaricoccus macauensis TaxID=57001 RepID=A0A840SHS0_9RHOB|nr:NADPH-dependent FMN reductase [Amaricoccus macauensis]MBB5220484.1 NAD(P)H-dependent FMN reductase [Amaricoccus macauensis]